MSDVIILSRPCIPPPVLLLKLLNPVITLRSYALFRLEIIDVSNTNSSHLLTKSSQPSNLHICITSSLSNLIRALVLHLLSLLLWHQHHLSYLRVTDRSFDMPQRYLWNQLPTSLHNLIPVFFSISVSSFPNCSLPHLLPLLIHHSHHP